MNTAVRSEIGSLAIKGAFEARPAGSYEGVTATLSALTM